ncbi:MAG: hypothetical protein DRQ88_07315 [Epsilonproteobacteria bacterium]|nr:MAG: hypothetical protein DRQ89_07750 [Campylobacterota bacterium]RLA66208.1 MAG: hypothetical protein DRQ88_07315 [Campylobacterota bacterium]
METKRISWALLFLRISVFLVMFMWTLDKFFNPAHALAVYKKFYFISNQADIFIYVIGIVEMVILFAFLLGIKKKYSYGLILILHGISTLSSYTQYLDPFANLLFFAAWPMLAACWVLFYLRDMDTCCTLSYFCSKKED